jgi:hypothetical protein
MIAIPLNAKVECTDGLAGYSTCMIVEPNDLLERLSAEDQAG